MKIKNGVVEIKPPKMLSSGGRIDCECSETVMRFLCGIAAGSGMRLELTGDRRLCQHSMRNVKEPLEAMGATVALKNYSVPPILVEGETVRPIDYFLPIGSSQVKSSILLCALTGKVRAIVTAEEHFITGGLGSAVAEVIAGKGGAKFDRVGVEDKFGQSGAPSVLFEKYGLTAENIAAKVRALL